MKKTRKGKKKDMSIVPENKACDACAKSKRKCGKEIPACHRCSSRGIDCVYSPARPSAFVRLQDNSTPGESCPTPTPTPSSISYRDNNSSTWDPNVLFPTLTEFDIPLPLNSTDLRLDHYCQPAPIAKHLNCDWFMSQRTWESPAHLPGPCDIYTTAPPYAATALNRFLKSIHQRVGEWVLKASNDFVHRQLYAFNNPRCIQDVYTALALYLAKTPENEDIVYRTLGDRVKQLLQDQEKHNTSSSLDVFNHLARCQALLVYQIIGLLDGDIRLRGSAEDRRATMELWLDQLLEAMTTASTFCPPNGDTNIISVAKALGIGIKDMLTDDHMVQCPTIREETVWHIWIFTESLRRTWIVSMALHTSYHAVRSGWATCCRSMKVTARKGVWEAPTSYVWGQRCMTQDILFIEGTEMEKLFTQVRPDEVDYFAKWCMEITYGSERMERWGATRAL